MAVIYAEIRIKSQFYEEFKEIENLKKYKF